MYVIDEDPQVYGLPADPKVAGVTIAWQSVIQPLGWAVGGLALLGLGMNFLVAREAKMARELPGRKKGGK